MVSFEYLSIFSKNMDLNDFLDEVMEKCQFIGFVCGVVYIFVIFFIQFWMKSRSKFKLKSFAVGWNLFLFLINLVMTVVLLPSLVYILIKRNFYESLCVDMTCHDSLICGFWLRMFPYVKIIELGDTILIVLQKRKLATYYWCHHLGVLLITWYLYPFYPTIALWFSVIISTSHVSIYLYGVTRSLGYSVPRLVPVGLLMSEIFQMVVGVIFCSFIYYYIFSGAYCNISLLNVSIIFFMFAFCFILCSVLYYERFYKGKKIIGSKSISTINSVVSEKV